MGEANQSGSPIELRRTTDRLVDRLAETARYEHELDTYPNGCDDPEPPSSGGTEADQLLYAQLIAGYTNYMLQV